MKPSKKTIGKKKISKKALPLINRNMMINEVVSMFPEAAEIMTSYGLHCVGCGASGFETLEEGTLGHGFSQDDLNDMLDELNEYAVGQKESNKNLKKEISAKPELAITLTEKAAAKFRAIAEQEGKTGSSLRLDAAKQGCCKIGYALNFESEVKTTDAQFTSHGITIAVNPASFRLVKGSQVDFEERETESGFKVHNPNEKECGCG